MPPPLLGKGQKWIDFCTELDLNPFLEAFTEKFPILRVFIHRVCIGELAAQGNKIRSQLVEDYLRAVAQTFLSMRANDPRLNSALKTDFRIARMLAAWKKEDKPANRVKPIPIRSYVALHTLDNNHLQTPNACVLLPIRLSLRSSSFYAQDNTLTPNPIPLPSRLVTSSLQLAIEDYPS